MATSTYTPIATQTLGSAAASITFSSIPGTYTDLRLVLTCTTSVATQVKLTFNGDTTTNYSYTYIFGVSGVARAGNGTFDNQIYMGISGSGTSTTLNTLFPVEIFSYAGSTNKTVLYTFSDDQNSSLGLSGLEMGVGLWRSTAAITSITLTAATGTFSTGSIATLWGI